jgi:predicted Fe-Mo cluster-binding NifX family protein
MTICFPVKRNDGLGSQIYEHFGLAPIFLLVDAKTGEVEEQTNRNSGRGGRQPFNVLAGKAVDAVVVGEIGKGALAGLHQAGLKVFQAQTGSIADNLTQITAGKLSELSLNDVCGGHTGAHGHGHGHGAGHEGGCGF